MILFGWTAKQWAIVFAQFPLASPDMDGVIACGNAWRENRNYQPGEEKLSAPVLDYESVRSVLNLEGWQGDKAPPIPEPSRILRPA